MNKEKKAEETTGDDRRGFIAKTLAAGAVKGLMDQGKVLHWGLSEPGIQTIRRAHAALPLTAIQNEYSMVWRGPEKDVIPICEELGIGFVPWWPLGCQLLTGWIDANTRFAPGDIRAGASRYSPENLPHNLKLVDLRTPLREEMSYEVLFEGRRITLMRRPSCYLSAPTFSAAKCVRYRQFCKSTGSFPYGRMS